MKLSVQKFSVEQFQDQKSWIDKLFGPLNNFMSQVYAGLNNQLTVADNLFMELKSISVLNESNNFPVKFRTKYNKYPEMVVVGTCIDSDGLYSSVHPLITWTFSDQTLNIQSISGLTASKKYTLKLLIIYE